PMQDLAAERAHGTFDVAAMRSFLDNNDPALTQRKDTIMLQLERDPVFATVDPNDADLSLAEVRERTMAKVRRFAEYVTAEPIDHFKLRMEMLAILDPGTWTRIGVHFGLFLGALQGQATPSQFAHWIAQGAMGLNGLTGCFAMTELGHGSNVAGLETTATFDPAADEFVVHTPTLTATKWWIGGAAQTATHAAVFAQLIVNGVNHGVKTLVVQLRDVDTFALRPGIRIGDIGAKMGRHGTDNGWIQFTAVRVPRSHLLMKHVHVARDGTVRSKSIPQLAYGALITGRVTMVTDAANVAGKALVIAVRYAAVRRQFTGQATAALAPAETKILDYAIHQYRLMPLLAQAYAFRFTAREVTRMYNELMAHMTAAAEKGPGAGGRAAMDNLVDTLKEMHGTSAGLKAFCTWSTLHTIDTCRQACGGHGYSSYTGLASTYADFARFLLADWTAVHNCTWEGDNTILTLQAGRYLVGCYRDANGLSQRKSKKNATPRPLPEGVAYLGPQSSASAGADAGAADLHSLAWIAEAFRRVAREAVRAASEQFEAALADAQARGAAQPEEEAHEVCSAARLLAARVHCAGYVFHRFHAALDHPAAADARHGLGPVLTDLCRLYGLHALATGDLPALLLQQGFLRASEMDALRAAVARLCATVRRHAVPLVDAFGLSDFMVNSPFGAYDGNVYERYFEAVRRSHPSQPSVGIGARGAVHGAAGGPAVPPYFAREIYPLLHRRVGDDNVLDMDEDD
ncbi:hypothetical protein CXG81DRAFT_8311, partial [Caulochytrium protostelioides]